VPLITDYARSDLDRCALRLRHIGRRRWADAAARSAKSPGRAV